MARYPSGVTIVTTRDHLGEWWGFTATSFCSASATPPLVLVCLAKTAECHPAFLTAEFWTIHVLRAEQEELARRFGTRGADKFAGGDFVPNADGSPVLSDSCATIDCDASVRYDAGDHTILVGEVTDARMNESLPAVYFQRRFRSLQIP